MMKQETGQEFTAAKEIYRSSLDLLFNISRDLATTLDLHVLLSRVLFLAVKNVNAERGTFVVMDEHQQPVDAAIIYGDKLLPHKVEQIQDILDRGLMGWVQQNRQAAFIPDTSEDDRWLHHDDDGEKHSGAKSAICVPLIAHEQLVGVLTIVHSQPGFFTQEHLNLLQSIADQAAIAVKNSLLFVSLQAARNRYRELFEDNIDPILITDSKGRIIEANRQATDTTQTSKEELLDFNISHFLGIDNDQVDNYYREINDQNTLSFETDLKLRSVEEIPIEVFIKKNKFEGQEQYQWILRDISERKAANTMRKDLTAMIYHDINNPLSNIFTSLDLVTSALDEQKDTNLKVVLSVFRRSAERMQRLINSLLDIERLEAGQSITNKIQTNFSDLVADAVQSIKPTLESKGQVIHQEIPATLPLLHVDDDMIKRVIINLIENASKFSPANGSIWIGVDEIDHQVKFWVEDEGPGIPKGAGDRIFDKFAHFENNHLSKGIGLGLAFCRLALQAHHGNIWVEPREDHGSRFVISLPIEPES